MRSRFAAGSWRTARDGWRSSPAPVVWNPALLHPYAWYDAHLSATSSQINDSSANARDPLAFAAGSNSPTLIDYATFGPGVRFAGNSSSVVYTTANTTVLDAAAALDIRIAMRQADWTVALPLCGKGSTAGGVANRLFTFAIASGGATTFTVSNGSVATTATASAGPGFGANSVGALRATWNGTTAKFFSKSTTLATAATDIADHTGWTQFGSDQALSTTANTATQRIRVGNTNESTGVSPEGTVLGAAWMSTTIDGTPAITFSAASSGGTGYTDPVSSVAWSVLRPTTGRKTVVLSPAANSARGIALFGSDDHAVMPAAAMPPLGTSNPATLVVVKRSWATIATGDRLLDSRADTTPETLGLAMHHDATTAASFRVGAGDGTATAGSSLTSANVSGTRTVYAAIVTPTEIRPFRNNQYGAAVTRPPATITTGGDVQIGRNANGTEHSDMELSAVLTFDRVLTSDELALLTTYYQGGV